MSGSAFLDSLQTAVWRGVPFKVVATETRPGRRSAMHVYPFRDGGWPEDMGRASTVYRLTGYLIGDLAPVLEIAIKGAAILPGPGLLIHPSLGALYVQLLSCSSVVSKEHLRVIQVSLEFIEGASGAFPFALVQTAFAVIEACSSALSSANTDLGGVAGPAAQIGTATAIGAGVAVTTAFCGQVALGGTDPTGIVAMATGLPPPDAQHTYGRYAYGSLTTPLPAGTTVQSLQASLATQRALVASTTTAASAVAETYSAAADMLDALAAVVEAMRAGITDPADQVRVLLGISAFQASYATPIPGSQATSAGIVAAAMAAACRRAALVSLARASAAYQPVSYDDAVNIRTLVCAALDTEITAAGDAGEDDTYLAFKALRASVIRDLTSRGASLPTVVTVTTKMPLPSLVLAQRLYQDASRSDQIAAETGVPHPAFCPTTVQVLSR
jgi:prophage DNA circulation protein